MHKSFSKISKATIMFSLVVNVFFKSTIYVTKWFAMQCFGLKPTCPIDPLFVFSTHTLTFRSMISLYKLVCNLLKLIIALLWYLGALTLGLPFSPHSLPFAWTKNHILPYSFSAQSNRHIHVFYSTIIYLMKTHYTFLV